MIDHVLTDVLHSLHELLLVELLRLLVGLVEATAASPVLLILVLHIRRGCKADRLPHCLQRVTFLTVTDCLTVVESLSARLCHRSGLIRQLQRTLARETDLVLLLHLIDFGLLLVHYVGQLELVVDF